MTRQGLILAGEEHGTRIAGLTILKRNILTLGRAGIRRIVVVGDGLDGVLKDRDYEEAGIEVTAAQEVKIAESFAVASCEVLYDAAEVEQALLDGASRELPSRFDVRTAEGRRLAEESLYRALRKPVDGWVSRHINRYLSLAVTRRLVDRDVTPNQMTIVATLIGAVGVWCVLRQTFMGVALGAVLVQLQSILDGCDGEIARLKFQSSKAGAWLDNVLDDVVNMSYGAALGIASAKLFGNPLYAWLGIGAAGAFTFYNLLVYAQLALVHRTGNPFAFRWWFQKDDADLAATLGGGGWPNRIGELVRSLARRDVFLLAFMILAIMRLPQVAVLWYAVLGAGNLAMTVMHLACRRGRV